MNLRYGMNRMMGRSPFHRSPANYKVNAAEGEILLYDEIGFWGISAKEFIQDLDAIQADEVLVRINSPGGEVFDGTAIFNAIRNDSRRITTQVDGLAASMASGIAMAGDEVRMAENAFMMIHNPWSMAWGDSEAMRKEADLLDKIGNTLAGTYAAKSGIKLDEVLQLMADETWFTGTEAKDKNLVDIVFADSDLVEDDDINDRVFDLSVFDQVPAEMKRTIESKLRDAGYSQATAKTAVSKGFQTLYRDDASATDRDDAAAVTEVVTALDAVIERVKTATRNK